MSRYAKDNTPRLMKARFDSTCPETGKQIKKGETIAYYPRTKTAYHESSQSAEQVRAMNFAEANNMGDANY